MKIVLDTNVLAAGLLSPFGPCGDILRMVASGNLTLCVDARVLSEYREALGRPEFGFDHERIAAILDYIEHHSRVLASNPLSHSLPDPDHEPFLEIAVSGGADYLVTGNAVQFPSNYCQGVEVVSPSDFRERSVKRRGRQEMTTGRYTDKK